LQKGDLMNHSASQTACRVGFRLAGLASIVALLAAGLAADAEPIALHPENSHYFLWRGRPTVLVTSTEHYGAVLNRAFDYKKYLDKLHACGFNLTRTFSGCYCEPAGAFKIVDNTLAPAEGKLICPWARSDVPGYAQGGNRFDLTRWDPEYFRRLRDFVGQAGRRGIVVEMVLFCPFYEDSQWRLNPMNAANNVHGIGKLARTDVYTLKDARLTEVQDAMVRKIVAELAGFDNLYYEICNEPYFGGVTLAWQAHVARTIDRAETGLGLARRQRHLIAQNIANRSARIEKPDPLVSIFNFHYAAPPDAVAINFGLGRPIGDDETGFRGRGPGPYRTEGWEFMLSGGAIYDHLDYSFTCGHEDGTATTDAPGGGGPEIQRQLKVLKDFLEGFDFVRMKPDNSVVKRLSPQGARATALVQPGRAYAIYVHGRGPTTLVIDLPSGSYMAEWVSTLTGAVDKSETFRHEGGLRTLVSPGHKEDAALRIVSTAPR
jgi:hypothetical protein